MRVACQKFERRYWADGFANEAEYDGSFKHALTLELKINATSEEETGPTPTDPVVTYSTTQPAFSSVNATEYLSE